MRSLKSAVPLLALLLALPAAAEGPKAGRWEYSMTMQMPGMPAMPKMPEGMQLPPGVTLPKMGPQGITTNFQQCVTEDQAIPRNEKGREDCTMTKQERKGNTFTWAATCNTPQGKADGEGTVTYQGDSMQGSMRIKGKDEQGRPFEMTQQMSGRYLGPCS